MRAWFGLLLGVIVVLSLGPIGCGKKERKEPARTEPVASVKMPEPLSQQKEPAAPKPAVKKDEPKQETKKDPDTPPTPTKTPIRGGSVVRRVDTVRVKSMLQQLNLAARNFEAERNRFPNSREELESYYEKNVEINEALKEGDVVFVWKAQKVEEPGKYILAYEGQPDTNGIRVVMMANGDFDQVAEPLFKEMKKVPTRK